MITFDPEIVKACRASYAAGVATGGGWPCDDPDDDQLVAFLRWLRDDYLESLETAQACAAPRVAPMWLTAYAERQQMHTAPLKGEVPRGG